MTKGEFKAAFRSTWDGTDFQANVFIDRNVCWDSADLHICNVLSPVAEHCHHDEKLSHLAQLSHDFFSSPVEMSYLHRFI
jgi:hypothetical protein